MKIFCLIGLHRWEYVQTSIRIPGYLRRICLHCGRAEYNPGTTL